MCCIVLCDIGVHRTIHYCILHYNNMLCCIVSYNIVQHFTEQYCIVLYLYFTLHNTYLSWIFLNEFSFSFHLKNLPLPNYRKVPVDAVKHFLHYHILLLPLLLHHPHLLFLLPSLLPLLPLHLLLPIISKLHPRLLLPLPLQLKCF